MAFWCMDFMDFLIAYLGMLRCFSCVIKSLWMTPLTHATMAISGLTFHPRCCRVSIIGSYFGCLMIIV